MPNLFARLAERTLGQAPVARPLTPPIFAPTPAVAMDAFTRAEPTATRPRQEQPTSVEPRRAVAEESASARLDLPLEKRLVEVTGEKAADSGQLRSGVRETPQPVLEPEPEAPPFDTDRPNNRAAKARAIQQAMEPGVESQTETAAAHPSRWLSAETTLDGADTVVRATSAGDTPSPRPPVTNERPALPAFQPTLRVPSRQARVRERGTDGNHGPAESVVEVSIGRIEVRAVFPEPQPMVPAGREAGSALSLADYLKERDRGLR